MREPSQERRRPGTIAAGLVVLVIGAVALGLPWVAAFGIDWARRPLSMTTFALLSGVFGTVITVRGLVMIIRAANHRN